MHHVARQLRVHTRMHALCTFPLFLFLFFFLSHSLRTPRFSNRETWNEPNFLCFSEATSKSSNLFRSSKEPKDRNIFFLNRTRFCVAQDLFNKSDARVACILYVFQDFESISFVERNKNDKETNIFKSQREEYIIRLRTKFFSQSIFQRVDRILSSLDIFLITLVKPTTNYPNRSTTRFKISTYFDDIVHHLEYHSLLDMFLKIVEFGMTIRLRQVL